jgi:hypothetical protein
MKYILNPKITIWVNFGGVGIFYGRLVYFTCYQEKSGNADANVDKKLF